eukprot:CAMPEP_0170175718 /NCGR_PEP_ID=MMETSP0040_2-20121228/8742_1 /TAXON_ID=641309 /ORGANISM="Lotharella oceanica, Strain CCMP622" /LENGTH=94 /DNA_ID=CAMNT_0010417795 /DNA_START=384 /DNA_END=668 /DNA_ORIENTATION=-
MPVQRPHRSTVDHVTRDDDMPVVAFRRVVSKLEDLSIGKGTHRSARRATDVETHVYVPHASIPLNRVFGVFVQVRIVHAWPQLIVAADVKRAFG